MVRMTYSVSTDVGGTLLDTNGSKSTLNHISLSVTDQVSSGNELSTLGVSSSASGVEDGEEITGLVVGSSITGDDLPCTVERSAGSRDLRKS